MRRAIKVSLWTAVLLAALSVVLLTATVYTYDRLTAETLIAELRFDATGERQYVAHLRTGDRCDERMFPVFGDQWRVDAGSTASRGATAPRPSRTRSATWRTI